MDIVTAHAGLPEQPGQLHPHVRNKGGDREKQLKLELYVNRYPVVIKEEPDEND
jgi:hypothetical protein